MNLIRSDASRSLDHVVHLSSMQKLITLLRNIGSYFHWPVDFYDFSSPCIVFLYLEKNPYL